MLVGFLDNVDRRRRVFHYCGIQYERFVSLNYNVAETEFYALPCFDRRNGVGVVSVIRYAIHGLKVQRAVSVEEVLNQNILGIRIAAILDRDGVVQCIANLGGGLIHRLGNRDFGNLSLDFGTGNFDIDLIGRNIRIGVERFIRVFAVAGIFGVFRIRTRHMCRGNVFQNMSGYICNLHRVGVGQNSVCTSSNLVDYKVSVNELIADTIRASNRSSKVVGVAYDNVGDVMRLAVVNHNRVGHDLAGLCNLLVTALDNRDFAILRDNDFNGVCLDDILAVIGRVANISFVDQRRGVGSLHRVGVENIDALTSLDAGDSPSMVAIVGVLGVVFRCNSTGKVVGVADQQVGNGLVSRVLHGNRVGHDFIDHRYMLVCGLLDVNGRSRVFHDSSVQDHRRISGNDRVSKVERNALTLFHVRNRVGVIAVIRHTIHRNEVQNTVTVKEVLDDSVLDCLSANICQRNRVVQRIANLGFRLIYTLNDFELAFRHINVRAVAGNLNVNLVRGDILVGVAGVLSGNVSRCDVLKNLGRNIGNLDRVGVVDHCVTASRNLVNDKFAVDELVASTVNALNLAREVVRVSQTDILDVVALSVVNRNRVSNDLIRLSLGLVGSLKDGDFTVFGLLNVNRVGRNVVVGTVIAITHIGGILDDSSIACLHRVGVGNVDGLAGFESCDGPSLITVVGVALAILGFDFALEVVRIAYQQVRQRVLGIVLHRNGVGDNLIDLRNVLVCALHNICGRFGRSDNSRVQDLRCITLNYHIGEVERYALASLDACNRVGVITVIGNAIHSHEVQHALAVKEVLDHDVFSIALTIVLDGNRVVQSLTDSGFALIYALCKNKVGNLGFRLGTRNLNINGVGRNLLIAIDRFVRVFSVTGVVRVFGVRAGNISRSDILQNLSRHITNFDRVGVG